MIDSLWGEEFDIPNESEQAKKIIQKIAKPKTPIVTPEKVIKSKTVSVQDKLRIISENVHRILGVYEDNTILIRTRKQLHSYIDTAISNGVIAIDTETNNSLDPLTCLIMGGCIYTPGQKNAYIPINHRDLYTGKRLSWQLTENDLNEEFSRLTDTKIIMHNGKFDYEVIKCTCGIPLKIYWDTIIGARVLDENEKASLKQQYISKIDPSIEKYDIENLFEKLEYAIVDPELFALYAATDAYMTYRLYEWQLRQFELPDNNRLYWLFKNVEMPIVEVTAELELTGVCFDKEYADKLSVKYHKKLDAADAIIESEINKFSQQIASWRNTPEANYRPPKKTKTKTGDDLGKSKSQQLDDPVNPTSPTQLAILIYDVLKCDSVDNKKPRGTGEDELIKLKDKYKYPLFDAILKKRELEKLIGTYIDKLPQCVNPNDGRIHANFNQYGADTGRFSSQNPNLQNIPSHTKELRLMFRAAPGCKLVGSDYSAQEPRMLATFSQDKKMIEAYSQGKDLYAVIAQSAFHNEYRENLEFLVNDDLSWKRDEHGEKILYPEGKKRRSAAKSILLGRHTVMPSLRVILK